MSTLEFPKAQIVFCPIEQTLYVESSVEFDFEPAVTQLIDYVAKQEDSLSIDSFEQYALDLMNNTYALEWSFETKVRSETGSF